MIIGIPKEIKNNENRVALTPAGAKELVKRGHTVYVQHTAGINSGFADDAYVAAGARILPAIEDVYGIAEMIVKVKEPIASEYPLVRKGQLVFTYFHFASDEALTLAMIKSGSICLAYETVENPDHTLPLLIPMSEVAGRMSVQEGARFLEKPQGGKGVLLGGVPGVKPGKVLVLGGGVVGDLTGFGAATYLRGIDFIQVPTTLLAQVDSSVGGKTGVDFQQYKNMVGAFHQPRLVYMNLSTLSSLPAEQFACGMGEILKTGLICDGDFFRYVCCEQKEIKKLDMEQIARMVRRCCEIKAGVVERDPKEQGERALLNLGHTVGHAVEKLKNFTLLHGQCVGVGLVAAAYLSMQRGLLTKEEYQEICQGCSDYDLPVHVDGLIPEEVLSATKKDKKMEQGHIRFILMDGIGKSFIDKTVTDEEMLSCIQEITL